MKILKNVTISISLILLSFLSITFFKACGYSSTIAFADSNTDIVEETSIPFLSQMTEDEAISFIISNDIQIPDNYINSSKLGGIVKDIIFSVESNPNCEFSFSYNVIASFAENIRTAVNRYYNICDQVNRQQTALSLNYTLRDSALWSNSGYLDYNCYAYAIGRDENPPEFQTARQYQPGDFSGVPFDINFSISEMAMVVQSDLVALGYSNVNIDTTISPSLYPYQKLICIRKGGSGLSFYEI